MKDRMDFKAALEAGGVKPDSPAAQMATADAAAARALAAAVLEQLPIGPAEGEDDEAWAAFGLTASAEDSWDFVADALDVAEIPATDSVEVLGPASAGGVDMLAPATPDVYAPTAPQFVKAPPNRGWMYGLAAMFLAGLGAFGLWFALDDKDGSDRFIAPTSGAPATVTPASAASRAPASAAVASAAPASAMAAPKSASPKSAAPASMAANTPKPKTRARRPSRRRSAPRAPTSMAPNPSAAPKPVARKPRKSSGEVDDLLSNLDGGGRKAPARRRARPAAAVAGDPSLPAKLSKSQILGVVRRSAGKVSGCKSRDPSVSGAVKVQMVIEPTGRVSSARPQGKYAGTPVGVCVAAKVRSFRFPQFSGDAMRINMPFRL